MPIYEYKCNSCGTEFEKLITKKETEILCPKCGKKDIKKKFSVFGMSGVESRAGSSGSGCSGCSSSACSTCR